MIKLANTAMKCQKLLEKEEAIVYYPFAALINVGPIIKFHKIAL